jgi:hypothetical protein
MSSERHELARQKLIYRIPAMDNVRVRRDVTYASAKSGNLTMDLYYPPQVQAAYPVIVTVAGYPDVGVPLIFGCHFKEMAIVASWCQAFAAAGVVAVAYTTENPANDVQVLLQYLTANAAELGIDATRIGICASSGNVPNALSLLTKDCQNSVRCAVLNYGFMLDLDGSTSVANASATYRFANPCAGKTMDDLRNDVPIFITRAGKDQFPGLNDCLDGFVMQAVERNIPVTVVNHASAAHAFDMVDDSAMSHHVIEHILSFVRFHVQQ